MPRTVFNVSPSDGGWMVAGDGGPSRRFSRKTEAMKWGREQARMAKPSQLRVKGMNGRIQTEHTYGSDPRETKG